MSFGVFSVGFVSIGVLSIAPFAAGVVGIGGISIGGAIAAGYLAVAPLAFAIKAAKGAMAFSIGFAEAPLAFAPHANDELARQYMDSSDCILQLDQWLPQSSAMATGSSIGYWVVALIVLLVLAQRLEFKRQVD